MVKLYLFGDVIGQTSPFEGGYRYHKNEFAALFSDNDYAKTQKLKACNNFPADVHRFLMHQMILTTFVCSSLFPLGF